VRFSYIISTVAAKHEKNGPLAVRCISKGLLDDFSPGMVAPREFAPKNH
jgi:hypothetical protein